MAATATTSPKRSSKERPARWQPRSSVTRACGACLLRREDCDPPLVRQKNDAYGDRSRTRLFRSSSPSCRRILKSGLQPKRPAFLDNELHVVRHVVVFN